MAANGMHTAPCPCQPRLGKPCTPSGDHLARYLSAETAGAISRDDLKAAITTLTVLAPHVIVRTTDAEPDPQDQRRTGT